MLENISKNQDSFSGFNDNSNVLLLLKTIILLDIVKRKILMAK